MTETNQQSSLLGKIAAYTEILAKDPSSTIFVSLGEAYRKMGMLDDARTVVERGLIRNPDFSPAHIVLARILCQQGDYSGSEAAFQRALEFDSGSLAALVGYARLCILLGHEQQARELLLQARQLSPADPIINKLLLALPAEADITPASVVERQEPLDDEEPEASAEQQVKPIALASITLAELYLKQGLEAEALEMYRQLSGQKPNDLTLRRQIRLLEERCGGVKSPAQETLADDNPEAPAGTVISGGDQPAEEVVAPSFDVALSAVAENSELEMVPDSPIGEDFPGNGRVLETLQQWLVTIRRRRGDV